MFKKLIFALLGSSVLLAAPAAAQTYVRPSKGTPISPFPELTIGGTPNLTSTYVSAAYDMSAFASIQISYSETAVGPGTNFINTYEVPNLPNYIKIQIVTDTGPAATTDVYTLTVLGSSAAAGPYSVLPVPNALVVGPINFDTVMSLITVKLSVKFTPIPYSNYSVPVGQIADAKASNPLQVRGAVGRYPSLLGGYSAFGDKNGTQDLNVNFNSVRSLITDAHGSGLVVEKAPKGAQVYTPVGGGGGIVVASPVTVPANGVAVVSFSCIPPTFAFDQAEMAKQCRLTSDIRLQNVGTTNLYCRMKDTTPSLTNYSFVLAAASAVDGGNGGTLEVKDVGPDQYVNCFSPVAQGKVATLVLHTYEVQPGADASVP